MDVKTKKAPGLLVSVRDEHEAQIVDQVGVDILDIKEPDEGALGRASTDVVSRILTVVSDTTQVSAAFGEVEDCEAFLDQGVLPDRLAFAKCGMARTAFASWQKRIESIWTTFRQFDCEPVAVAYADHTLAFAPKPREILDWAIEHRVRYFLIDTFEKRLTSLFDSLLEDELVGLLSTANKHGMKTVLAGSIRVNHLESAVRITPDFIGVRGAVCDGDRNGKIESKCVEEFKELLLNKASSC